MDNKDFNSISENMAQELCDAFSRMNEALEDLGSACERTYGVITEIVKEKCAEKLIFYADKYAHATFITRWYWKRKMKKFIKGIDVLKEL